ncbi:hypothetical protein HMP0721_2127 [Pseudoramibacter alactolyticus ATCC 23263]|uniref:Uncharacterized protein n=1 Tax=Pseudoramibacter alactolyticus ATCC 23263 TaxID=887929 RepID=E6MJE2_9FIRM|nr:hypothetical protein HMP0721_2127 [Pseudoramibacter alactolyticus ATCC 23263]
MRTDTPLISLTFLIKYIQAPPDEYEHKLSRYVIVNTFLKSFSQKLCFKDLNKKKSRKNFKTILPKGY